MKRLILSDFIILLLFLSLYSCSKQSNTKLAASAQSLAVVAATATASSDSYYSYQWHLKNTGQLTDLLVGEDINVTSVWDSGNKGDDVVIAVIDDGLQINHPDLSDNIYSGRSWNYLYSIDDPSPEESSSGHGTAVAGLAAARDSNGIGVRGVAPRAKVVGYNLLALGGRTDADETDAMTRNYDLVSISNNSWGATDGTGKFTTANSTWTSAITEGVTYGRNGKGVVYVWAAGNGANNGVNNGSNNSDETEIDRSDYDGQANFYGVMAIGATTDNGEKASYSESGSNLWICAPSSGGKNSLTTTDLINEWGYNTDTNSGSDLDDVNYTKTFTGTSGATPIVSGVVALMLKQNSKLTWRDVKLILAQTARKIQSTDTNWVSNGAGYKVNYKFGFGVVDAKAAVAAANTWSNVGTLKTYTASSSINLGLQIVDVDKTGTTSSITVDAGTSQISKIEFIEVNVDMAHANWGDLTIELSNSASPITSIFSKPHFCNNGEDYPLEESCKDSSTIGASTTFRFGSARHLEESSSGIWTLKIVDSIFREEEVNPSGVLNSWSIIFYGRE
ncbi:MAG: S8 family serine peptidase [Oligoflexia bacterium]|nr:S8 family serine peptidase [Oligoflexia bacterium]